MIIKKPLSILLAVLIFSMIITSFPFTAYAVGVDTAATGEAVTYSVSTAKELEDAVSTINAAGAGEYVIALQADISDGHGMNFTTAGQVVTIIGNGHTLTHTIDAAVHVGNGSTVNLGDGETALTLKGGVNNDEPGIVYVIGTNSVCNMYDKVTLKDHKGNNYLGGGVTVESGTFHMYGGIIENCGINGGSVCYGGGVAVINGGTFIMDGGTIKNCYVESTASYSWQIPYVAGGGVFVCRASFTMNSGSIENCRAINGDAVGGGIAIVTSIESVYDYRSYGYLDSDFTMNGGEIKNCSSTVGGGALAAGMKYINTDVICTTPVILSGSSKPGVYLNGGSMTGNESTMGGAIFLNWIRPSIPVNIKNMLIDSNSADEGGAIDVLSYWTRTQIDGCTITNNTAEAGGGAIMLDSNSSSSGTHIKDTTITGNISGDKGAGIYYDANSTLTVSGTNIIQNNTYNGTLNNLNVLSLAKPVYVGGDLTGSRIGLSDPTLWDDGLEDTDPSAVSTNYLTSGYKTYNSENPSTFFSSDHATWVADFSDVNTNEVRLVHSNGTVDYHINNDDIAARYDGNDLFTSYVEEALNKEITIGDTIESFFAIPEITPTAENSCPYIFKGWYYDQNNSNDANPVNFGTDVYTAGKDIYAHWIKVENVAKDDEDTNILPAGDNNEYGGFDLSGVQVREGVRDTNFDDQLKSGGMRFLTSLSMDVVNEINAIKENNIEYGYVAATNEGWINYHRTSAGRKLLYESETANGIDTKSAFADDENYFGFAMNINCTSELANAESGVVAYDHRNYSGYLLYTLVITYEGDNGTGYDKNVLARPYIRYTDANGLERVAYSEYRGTNVLGGCYTNYNAVAR